MKSLFGFFLPHILKQTLLLAGIFSVLLVLFNFLDLKLPPDSPFHVLIIWVIFPIISYYNSKCYLPSSINWILLSPIKKTHIIYTHIILNIFKTLLILALSSLIWRVFASKFSLLTILQIINDATPETFYGLETVSFILSFFVFFFFIYVSIMPSLQARANKGEKQELTSILQNKKNIKYTVIGLGLLLMGAEYYEDIELLVPSYVFYSALKAMLITVAFMGTLVSVKLYFKKSLKFIVFGAAFLLMLTIYSVNVHLTFKYDRSDIQMKLQDFQELNYVSKFYKKEMAEALVQDSQELKMLRESDITLFFENKTKTSLFTYALKHWSNACIQNDAVGCRIEAYLISARDGIAPIENYRKACPRDDQSCLNLFNHDSATAEDKLVSEIQLDKVCDKSFPSKEICCRCYEKDKKKK